MELRGGLPSHFQKERRKRKKLVGGSPRYKPFTGLYDLEVMMGQTPLRDIFTSYGGFIGKKY